MAENINLLKVKMVQTNMSQSSIIFVFQVIYQTRETVFHRDIQTPRRELKDVQRSVFDEIRGVWIADETLSRVIDLYRQTSGDNLS